MIQLNHIAFKLNPYLKVVESQTKILSNKTNK